MNHKLIYFALLFALGILCCVKSDDGLCGIEPPKEGESCSGSTKSDHESSDDDAQAEDKIPKYDFVEKPLTEDEKKRAYPKIRLDIFHYCHENGSSKSAKNLQNTTNYSFLLERVPHLMCRRIFAIVVSSRALLNYGLIKLH